MEARSRMASKMLGKRKRQGVGLEMKTFKGNDQQNYLVFRTPKGSYHVFLEVEAKASRSKLWCLGGIAASEY